MVGEEGQSEKKIKTDGKVSTWGRGGVREGDKKGEGIERARGGRGRGRRAKGRGEGRDRKRGWLGGEEIKGESGTS